MTELRFFVAGTPAAQGSMKCVGNRGGFHQLIASNKQALQEWRNAVVAVAEWTARTEQWQPLTAAETRMIFRLTRPQSHYRTGRNAALLRDDAPAWPAIKGLDLDKAVRAIFDSLTAAQIVVDDSVIIGSTERKTYCEPGQPPGVNVVVTTPAPAIIQPALIGATTL